MENIMDFMSAALQHGDALSGLSAQMHESPGATRRGIETAVPATFAALAAYGASSGKAEELVGAIRGGNYPHVDLEYVENVATDPEATAHITQSSSGLLERIFGNRLDGAIDAIAGTSGLGRNSASTLLGVAAPLVMGFVGKQVTSGDLDARGLGAWLAEQGRKAVSLLPAPLAAALGASAAIGGDPRTAGTANRVRSGAAEVERRTRIRSEPGARPKPLFWWILGALMIALLAWQLLHARQNARNDEQMVPDAPRGQ